MDQFPLYAIFRWPQNPKRTLNAFLLVGIIGAGVGALILYLWPYKIQFAGELLTYDLSWKLPETTKETHRTLINELALKTLNITGQDLKVNDQPVKGPIEFRIQSQTYSLQNLEILQGQAARIFIFPPDSETEAPANLSISLMGDLISLSITRDSQAQTRDFFYFVGDKAQSIPRDKVTISGTVVHLDIGLPNSFRQDSFALNDWPVLPDTLRFQTNAQDPPDPSTLQGGTITVQTRPESIAIPAQKHLDLSYPGVTKLRRLFIENCPGTSTDFLQKPCLKVEAIGRTSQIQLGPEAGIVEQKYKFSVLESIFGFEQAKHITYTLLITVIVGVSVNLISRYLKEDDTSS
jgi:hypothetical protein